MKKTLEHAAILCAIILAIPLFAVALMTMWNGYHLTYFLDYYHALLLTMLGFGIILLTEFIIMIWQWLYVDEIFDYHRKEDKKP